MAHARWRQCAASDAPPPGCGVHPVAWCAMDWFSNNWPIVLVALAVFIIGTGLVRKVAKLAFIGVAIGALGLVVWPYVSDSF